MGQDGATAPQKVCVRCKRDCSHRPRTKDQHGRYTCRECMEAMQTKTSAASAPRAAASAGVSTATAEGGDDVNPAFYGIEAAAPAAAEGGGPCQGCGNYLPAKVVVCTNCGFNTKTGSQLGVRTGTEELPDEKDVRRASRKKEFAKATRAEYLKASLVAAGGIALALALFSFAGAANFFANYLLFVLIFSVVTAVTYVACGIIWIGFDAAIPLMCYRAFAACSVVAAVQTATAGLPMMWGRVAFLGLLLGGILMQLGDLDLQDAAIVGTASIGLTFVTIVTLAVASM